MAAIREGADGFVQPSFSLSNRLARVGWGIVYNLLFRPSPRPLHEWRSFLLRCFGAKIGKDCHVYPSVKIWAPWNLVLDDGASMGDDVICYSIDTVHLGKRVVISQFAHLCTGTHDYTSPNFQLYARPIHIGANGWVCANSFIGPGVSVGEGSVIGAGSVVTKSMPDWMVCAGNPCKPLKPRIMKESSSAL